MEYKAVYKPFKSKYKMTKYYAVKLKKFKQSIKSKLQDARMYQSTNFWKYMRKRDKQNRRRALYALGIGGGLAAAGLGAYAFFRSDRGKYISDYAKNLIQVVIYKLAQNPAFAYAFKIYYQRPALTTAVKNAIYNEAADAEVKVNAMQYVEMIDWDQIGVGYSVLYQSHGPRPKHMVYYPKKLYESTVQEYTLPTGWF